MCPVINCEKPAYRTGLCRRHYRFKRIYGDVNYNGQTRYMNPVEERTEKVCILCGMLKPIKEFPNRGPKANNKTKNECKKCFNDYSRMRKYGVTKEWYEAKLKENGGVCPICKKTPKLFVIDHDHACCPARICCGKCVRNLLCYGCNSMLGQSGDSIETLTSAINYLKDFEDASFDASVDGK